MTSILDSLKEINKRELCVACRSEREYFKPNDQKGFGEYSNMIPGFFSIKSQNISGSNNIDVLFIANSHGGGGGEEVYRDQHANVQTEIDLIRNYYLQDTYDSYHQEQMCLFLKDLDKRNISWYFTDLVKCFVAIESKKIDGEKKKLNNFKIAINHCKEYLKFQLENIHPKIIVCLGLDVFRETKKILSFKAEFAHGKYTTVGKSIIISSYFPSERTANRWVKNGKWHAINEVINNNLKISL